MMGNEWLCSSTASDGVEHRSLDGNKVTVIKPPPDVRVDLGAGMEDIARTVVDHQVKVSLPEPLLGILETEVVARDLV